MLKSAEEENFERAAMIRDALEELRPFLEHSFNQKVEFLDEKNVDVFSFYKGDKELDVSLYMIRQGSLLGHKSFHFSIDDLLDEISEELIIFMLQYYGQSDEPIPEMIVADLSKNRRKTSKRRSRKPWAKGRALESPPEAESIRAWWTPPEITPKKLKE